MEDGEVGDHGQHVTETVGDQDLDLVTTPPRPMEDLHVMAPVSQLLHVQEGIAQEMDCGEVGHHGQLVEATVRIQDQEVATILLRQMGVKLVKVLVKYLLHVQGDNAKLMVCGGIGLLGQRVKITA